MAQQGARLILNFRWALENPVIAMLEEEITERIQKLQMRNFAVSMQLDPVWKAHRGYMRFFRSERLADEI